MEIGDIILHSADLLRVTSLIHSRPGAVGRPKTLVKTTDLKTGETQECVCATSSRETVANVDRATHTLLDIDDDGFATLLCEDGTMREDLRAPPELRKLRTDTDKELKVVVVSNVFGLAAIETFHVMEHPPPTRTDVASPSEVPLLPAADKKPGTERAIQYYLEANSPAVSDEDYDYEVVAVPDAQ